MTRAGVVVRPPHEDSSIEGDPVGKGDTSDVKSCPETAGSNGLGESRGASPPSLQIGRRAETEGGGES